ncbi:MAG: ABC transporter substrate-binding protein [Chloroflexota bacterium]|nr:ABC transporter substrate-binding protein [Chloroflexota bacterium]
MSTKTHTYRWTSVLAIFMALALVLTACVAPAVPQAPPPAEPVSAPEAAPAAEQTEEPVEVVFWAALGGNNGKILEDMVTEFNASQNEVQVKYEFQGAYSDTEQKFLTALAADLVPDLVMLEISRIPGFANAEALLPLDDFANGPDGIDQSDFAEALLNESRINGKLYSLPQARSMPVFYYNKTMFEEAGLDSSKAPENWDALREAAIAVTKEDGSQIGFGIQIGNPWWYFQEAVENIGADVSRADPACAPTFNEAEAVAALQWWYDLVNSDGAAKIYAGQGLTTWEQLQADFISGKVGMMYITTGWMGNIEANSPFEVGVGMLAAGPSDVRKAPTGGNGLVIPAKAPEDKQVAAWTFLKWLTDTPQTAAWAKATGYMPLRLSAINDPALQAYFQERPNFKVAVEQMQYASGFPCIKLHPKTERTLDVLWERIFVGQEEVQTVADETAAEVEVLMQEMKP